MLMEIYTSCSRVVPQILHTFLFQPFGSQKLHITNSLNPTGITSGAFQPSPWPAGYFCVMLPSNHPPTYRVETPTIPAATSAEPSTWRYRSQNLTEYRGRYA